MPDPVKLKPDWDYEFSLNCMSYDSFRSEDNVPLEPVAVSQVGKKEAARVLKLALFSCHAIQPDHSN